MSKRISVAELMAALATEEGIPEELAAIGFVKRSEKEGYVLFSPSASCRKWLKVPIQMIAAVEPLGKVPCRDHEHDLVRLIFTVPESEEGRILSELYRSSTEREAQSADAADTSGLGEGSTNPCYRGCDLTHRGTLAGCNRLPPAQRATCRAGALVVWQICRWLCLNSVHPSHPSEE